MRTIFKIAWRNLWRNKRRTLITVASVLFGVVFSTVMSSMQEGMYQQFVDAVVKFYSGSLQIQHKEYWDNQNINNTFHMSDAITNAIAKSDEISAYSARLESFALASTDDISKGAMLLGIDPIKEDQITHVAKKITQGKYLNPDDEGVLLGEGLAEFLKLKVNDTLVLLGQGYHGVSAAGKFPVRGLIKHSNPEFNKMIVYMNLPRAQQFYSAEKMVTSYVMMVNDADEVRKTRDELQGNLNSNYRVMSWDEINSLVLKQIESDRQGGIVMKGLLYLIIAFGILGTIMMMMQERKREMGVMIAIGMQKKRLQLVFATETVLIGLVGVVAGMIVSAPICWYYYVNPISLGGQYEEVMIEYGFEPLIRFSLMPKVFLNQAITVFVLTLAISIYPLLHIGKLKVINALKA